MFRRRSAIPVLGTSLGITSHSLLLASNSRSIHDAEISKKSVLDTDDTISYREGEYHMIPKKYTVDKKISVRTYLDRNRTELSDRTYMPQKAWFEPYTQPQFFRDYQRERYNFYNIETKLIWKAFDTPELIGILFHDETIKGNREMYSPEMLEKAFHWTMESRYWRCIGITKPFYDANTLRIHCHEKNQYGGLNDVLVMSQAMRHALMDLERAVRRKELGLEPNYIWDRWGPIGFIDGARNDYLPRFEHNPYVDPDGITVTELDVMSFDRYEQIKERYKEIIEPDTNPYDGVFAAPSHGFLGLEDVPNPDVVALYRKHKNQSNTTHSLPFSAVIPSDMRTLFYLSAMPDRWLDDAQKMGSWEEVTELIAPVRSECDPIIDAARLLKNTRDDVGRVRRFFEEKCGFEDFMYTPDKEITAAVLCYLKELKRLVQETEWGENLARCLTDGERVDVMGKDAFIIYKHIEDTILDQNRRRWTARFSGEAHEESTLDYLLENFGRRTETPKNVGSYGTEFDREQEPIGRQVQRRILDADKANKLAQIRRSKGKMWSKKTSVFDALHEKQMQNFNYGVR